MKILLAKPGLDGHDVGVKVLAHALIEAGFDVVYSGLRKTIHEIIAIAAEKNADLIGLSILSGTHVELCEQMRDELKRTNHAIDWIVGGNIPDGDVATITALGAQAAFPTGTTIEAVIGFCRRYAELHAAKMTTESIAR
jgi:methylmalonyl-CoA mutase C-terminal domain/subunit